MSLLGRERDLSDLENDQSSKILIVSERGVGTTAFITEFLRRQCKKGLKTARIDCSSTESREQDLQTYEALDPDVIVFEGDFPPANATVRVGAKAIYTAGDDGAIFHLPPIDAESARLIDPLNYEKFGGYPKILKMLEGRVHREPEVALGDYWAVVGERVELLNRSELRLLEFLIEVYGYSPARLNHVLFERRLDGYLTFIESLGGLIDNRIAEIRGDTIWVDPLIITYVTRQRDLGLAYSIAKMTSLSARFHRR